MPDRSRRKKSKTTTVPPRKSSHGHLGPYKGLVSGVGYRPESSSKSDETLVAPSKTSKDDAKLLVVFDCLYLVLSADSLDSRPQAPNHQAYLLAALHNSRLFAVISELLINHSIEDIVKRASVYQALIKLLEFISTSAELTSLILEPRAGGKSYRSLVDVTSPEIKSKQSSTTLPGPRVIDLIVSLTEHTSEFVARAQKNASLVEGDEELQDAIRICDRLVTVQHHLCSKENAPPSASNGKGKAKAAVDDPSENDPGRWFRANCVTELADEVMMQCHAYSSAAAGVLKSSPGRMKKILMELTNLRSSLPQGIFVKHGESRIDLLKVLIIGSHGTPYENGLFEFDFFCPEKYPQDPPQVTFKTTGGGRAHFNPNLYRCGKVCLSLLGTWDGEPWRPNQSSLLQVLVSIQSMVLCDEPWANEPGREQMRGSLRSLRYQHEIRDLTTRYAITPWAELLSGNTSQAQSIWLDVVRKHFEDNADLILFTTTRWQEDKVSCKLPPKQKSVSANPHTTFGFPPNSAASTGQGVPMYAEMPSGQTKINKPKAANTQKPVSSLIKPPKAPKATGTPVYHAGPSTATVWSYATASSPPVWMNKTSYGYPVPAYHTQMNWPLVYTSSSPSSPPPPTPHHSASPSYTMLAPGTKISPGAVIAYQGKAWRVDTDAQTLIDVLKPIKPGAKFQVAEKLLASKTKHVLGAKAAGMTAEKLANKAAETLVEKATEKIAEQAILDELIETTTATTETTQADVADGVHQPTTCAELLLSDLPFHPSHLPYLAWKKLGHLVFDDWRQDKVNPRLSFSTLMGLLSLSWEPPDVSEVLVPSTDSGPPGPEPLIPVKDHLNASASSSDAADDVDMDDDFISAAPQSSIEASLSTLRKALSHVPQGRVSTLELLKSYAAHELPDMSAALAKEQPSMVGNFPQGASSTVVVTVDPW